MNDRPRRPRVAPALCSVLLAMLQPAVAVRAQPLASSDDASRRLRVVVHAPGELDRTLLDRVRGQLSDLAVELIAVTEPARSAELAGRARQAQELAAAQNASVAIWFALEPDAGPELLVFVSVAGRDPVLVRRIASGDQALQVSSGLLESAALVVRSSLRTLAQGEPLGVELAEPPVEREARPSPPAGAQSHPHAAPASASADRELEADAERETGDAGSALRPRFALFAGWHGAADGSGSPGQHGAQLGAQLELGAFELGASAILSYRVTRSDQFADVRIARHGALASLGVRFGSGSLAWSLGAHAGMVLFQRTTSARSDALEASGSRVLAAFALGPSLAAAWMPGSFGLGMQLGLDVLPDAPRFVYEHLDGDRTLAYRPWALQPRAALGVIARLR